MFGAILGKALPMVGKAVLGLGKAAIGSAIGGFFDRKSARDQRADMISQYAAMGLTPQEIAGVGPGSTAQGGSTVLGNQAAALAQQQMEQNYQERQFDLNRAVQLSQQETMQNVANTNAAASVASSSIAANASKYSADKSYDAAISGQGNAFDIAAMTNDRETQKMWNDWTINNPEMKLRLAQMSQGIENTKMSLFMEQAGLLPSQLGEGVSASEFARRMNNLMINLAASEQPDWVPFGNAVGETGRQVTSGLGQMSDWIFGGTDGTSYGAPMNTPPMPSAPMTPAPR
jgi:hypothetical protein